MRRPRRRRARADRRETPGGCRTSAARSARSVRPGATGGVPPLRSSGDGGPGP